MTAATEASLTKCCSSMQSASGGKVSVHQATCVEGEGNLTRTNSVTCLQLRITAVMLLNLRIWAVEVTSSDSGRPCWRDSLR